jgi:hypothetical protein
MIKITITQCGYPQVFTSNRSNFGAAIIEMLAAFGTDFEGDLTRSVRSMVRVPA